MSGLFISFEGLDGVGKSIIIKEIANRIKEKHKKEVLLTAEPTNSQLGKYTKEIILKNSQIPLYYQSYLFVADRLSHFFNNIGPALEKNLIVFCDRYHDSTIAYQGTTPEKRDFLYGMYDFIFKPHKTILINTKIGNIQQRIAHRKNNNTFDKETENFFLQVRKNYQWIKEQDKNRIWQIENDTTLEKIIEKIEMLVVDWIKA